MSNTIQLKSVRDLMEVNYFIPSYQRGYRWEKPQIDDLLDDIYSFAIKENKGKKEFYCLQPIVVRKVEGDNLKGINHLIEKTELVTYEVIDGQQRLTTLLILLKYIKEKNFSGSDFQSEYGFDLYSMTYETRPELNKIFDNLSVENDSNIDYHHITKSFAIIDQWFSGKQAPRGVRESVLRTLVDSFATKKPEGVVQVIWYEINDNSVNPISTFLRINLGKIPLTNGELVKALFLQSNIFGVGELADMQQIELANKWDHIERSLRDEKFWWFISNDHFEGSTRIDYILNLYYQKVLAKKPDIELITGKDKHQIFRFYNHLLEQDKSFNGVEKIWNEIEMIFDQINEWYNNPKWFHYIGFLIYKQISVLDILTLIETKEIEKGSKLKKSDLTDLLVEVISTYFTRVKKTNFISPQDDKSEDKFDTIQQNLKYLDVNYSDSSLVRDILLLYNLEYIVNHSEKNELIYKFPFNSFKNLKNEDGEQISWDIEHIDSSTDTPLDKFKDQKIWLENALVDIFDSLSTQAMLEPINLYILGGKKSDDFQKLYEDIKKIAQEENNDDRLKNNIGNLALLDSKTNRGYGNALFISKRRIIIDKDKKGTFIPQLTKNVFLKYTNVGNIKSQWTKKDIELYNQDIFRSLSLFIK